MGPPAGRAVQGAILGLGAPVGWLVLRALAGHGLGDEFTRHVGLYVYLLVPTVLSLASFGVVFGIHENKLQRLNARLSDDALTDELTGLKNLRYFRARLDEEHAASERDGTPLSLLMIDFDRFKRVNDRYGHPEGDLLLKGVAGAIASVVRRGETAARVAGEEFALLPGAAGEDAYAAAERVLAAVGAVRLHPSSRGGLIKIAVSVGCASTADLGGLTPEELYGAADSALYAAKNQGRDRTVRAGFPRSLTRIDSGA
ncbi:MAG: GGDEF domain-containing protein [Actinomycetota bacterium]